MQPSFENWQRAEQESILAEPWPEIEPFDAPVETDDFILETLPEPVSAFCKALCTSLCVRPGLVGPLALGALATVFQRRYSIQGKEDWLQPLSLYTIVSAPPSAGKSPALDALLKPLRIWEKEKREEEAPVIASARTERRIMETRLANLEKQAARSKGKEGAVDELEAKSLSEQLANMKTPMETVLFTADCTSEAAVALLERQGGMLTVASDEGGFLQYLRGRYTSNIDIDWLLQAYSGSEIRVNRIGRGSTIVQNPRLSVLLCCQPVSLEQFMSDDVFQDRGAVARFLYSQPSAYQGKKTVDALPIPADVADEYFRFICDNLDNEEKGVIRLSSKAWRLFVEVVDELENLPAPSDIWDGWRGKYRGNLLRVAGILHASHSERPLAEPVSARIMAASVAVMDYFRQQFEALLQSVGTTKTEQDARYLLNKLNGITEISRRDLHQKCKGHLKKAVDLDQPLRELEERGFIREKMKATNGRPTQLIQVNPQLHSQSQNAQK